MLANHFKSTAEKVIAFPLWRGIGAIPGTGLETLSWVLTIKTNLVVGLLLILLTALLLPGIPYVNLIFLIACSLSYLAFLLLARFLVRVSPSNRRVLLLTHIMIPIEVTISTLDIYFTGGVLTPMFIVYTLSIVMSIILLTPSGVYRITAFAIFQYCALAFIEGWNIVPRFHASWGEHELFAKATFGNYAAYVLIVCCTLIGTAYLGDRIASLIKARDERIKRQVSDLRSIYSISHTLGSMSSDIALAEYLAPTLRKTHNATIALITFMNSQGKVEIVATCGLSPDELAVLRAANFDDLPGLQELLKAGQPLVIEDLQQLPQYLAYLPNRAVRSVYAFPMLVDERMLGTICILFPQRNALSEEYCDLLRTIANQAGVAIQRARLFEHTQRMANEMSALYDVGLHTGSTLSTNEVIKRTANNMEQLMKPNMSYIALYDAASDTVSFEYAKDHDELMPRMKVTLGPEGYGLTGRIIRTKQPLLVSDWNAGGHAYEAIAQKAGTEMLSYLGVPMIFDERVIGVLSVQAVEANVFNEESQRLLEAMAAQTAMALENAHLHALAQEAAQIDSLTRAYNHGRFIELVDEAITESNKNDSQVSLIMLDIDFFKQYNDTFGHVAGDHVLALTAQALKNCVREADSVGRWGGEEFGVLLPGLSIEDAKRVARRIRHAIAELIPLDANGTPITSPTISQGISTYPYPSCDARGLIEDADAALYYAKEHGRNQLVMFDTRGSHELIFRTGTLTTATLVASRKPKQNKSAGYSTNDLDSKQPVMHDATTITGDL